MNALTRAQERGVVPVSTASPSVLHPHRPINFGLLKVIRLASLHPRVAISLRRYATGSVEVTIDTPTGQHSATIPHEYVAMAASFLGAIPLAD